MIKAQRKFNPIKEEKYIVESVLDFLSEIEIKRGKEFSSSEVIIERLPNGRETIKVGKYFRIVSRGNPQIGEVFKIHWGNI